MTQLQAILLCDLVVQTPEGKVQLQGLFDVIHAAKLSDTHGRMWVFFRFLLDQADREKESHTVRLFLHRPDGETETLPQLKVKVGHQGTVQGYVQLQGLPLKQTGQHWLELFYDEERVGSCRFFVRGASPQAAAQPSSASTVVH